MHSFIFIHSSSSIIPRCLLFNLTLLYTMDLGFGTANQVVGEAAAQVILQSAQAQEQALQDEISRYDSMLNDDQALESIRQKRLREMQQQQQQKQKWLANGHGVYQDLSESTQQDVAKAFFETTKSSDNVVVHFYRPSTRHCDVFHAHLEKLAKMHLEAKFCKINVEGCDGPGGAAASYLVDKLGIHVMPTLVLIKNRKAIHHIRGFDELGGTSDFSTRALEYVLGYCQVIQQSEDAEVPPELTGVKGVNAIKLSKGRMIRGGIYDGDLDEDE